MAIVGNNRPTVLAALKKIGAPDPLLGIFERLETQTQDVLAQRFAESKTTDLIDALEAEADAAFDRSVTDLQAAITQKYESEEGQVRGAARDEVSAPSFETESQAIKRQVEMLDRTRRAVAVNTEIALLAQETDAAAIQDSVEHALLAGDDQAIRAIGRIAEQRLAALEAADHQAHVTRHPGRRAGAVLGVPDYTSPIAAARAEVSRQLQAWRAEHPTLVARLRAIETQRRRELADLESHARTIRQHLGRDRAQLVRNARQRSA